MESLPHVGLAKTYNIDAQTADSAGTATAYLTGVKTRIGVLGLDGRAVDCPTSKGAELDSMLKWAHHAGKSVGLVTTSRITHATPGGSYAHVPDRDWEAFGSLTTRFILSFDDVQLIDLINRSSRRPQLQRDS